jgi:hypothetical protein
MRLFAVFGLLAVGVVAMLASLAVVHLQGLVRHLKNADADTRDLARLIERRQAAWKQR